MPRLDGFEFVRELRTRPIQGLPPVIAVSGLTSEASRVRASQAGFEGHLKKPFDEISLVAAVQAALAARRERDLH
jgi:CheY-like chemotaxis protein